MAPDPTSPQPDDRQGGGLGARDAGAAAARGGAAPDASPAGAGSPRGGPPAGALRRHAVAGPASAPGPASGPGPATPPGGVASHRRDRRIKSRNRALAEWVVAIGLAVLAALAIKTWFVQAFIIPSQSMEQTLEVGDRVLVAKFAYQISDIGRGDVVVFKNPDRLPGEPAQLIKRVVGLPGDVLEASDGRLVRNGVPVAEPFVPDGVTTGELARTVVPEGHLFVMGDNRPNSRDSRFIGPVPEDLVVGKAFFRIWPPSRLGGL